MVDQYEMYHNRVPEKIEISRPIYEMLSQESAWMNRMLSAVEEEPLLLAGIPVEVTSDLAPQIRVL